MKAALVTIGTEITDGQIVDRNSQWLSLKLETHNIKTVLHMSVPDTRDDMIDAIMYAGTHAELIFVCGGLGPTSDDFTRDVIAEVLQQPLELHDPSWMQIKDKLNSRGVTLREGHKHQAMIPKNAEALENDAGVAPGIYANASGFIGVATQLWVLPGPPKEIEAIWNRHIHPRLETFETDLNLKLWKCSGVPESELAFLTEDYFTKFNFTKKFGYRFQPDRVVEVKLWYEKNNSEADRAIADFDQIIGKFLVRN